MKKKLIIFLSVLVVLMLSLTLFACGTKHKHSYSEKYVGDDLQHWHECFEDGCDNPKIDVGDHDDRNKDGACDVCGHSVYVEASGISLNETTLDLSKGESVRLTATVKPDAATDKDVKWSSDNEDVATVDQTGFVTAKGVGTAKIKAQVGKCEAVCTVNVTLSSIRVESVTLPSELTLNLGGGDRLSPSIVPSDASNQNVSFKSDNTSVVTVNDNGEVSAVGVGVANVTVTTEDGNKTATCKITVVIPVESVSIDGIDSDTLILKVGEERSLSATVQPENATVKAVIWEIVSDPQNSITLTEDGTLKAVAAGAADIRVRSVSGNKTVQLAIGVEVPVTGVSFEETKMSLPVGNTATLEPIFTPANASNKNVTWKSSDEDVLTVDKDGNVIAVAGGVATVTVTAEDGNFTADCEITVVISVTGVTIEGDTIVYIAYGSSKQLVANVAPANATNKNVTWSVSGLDEGVVVDEDGNVSFTEAYRGWEAYVTVTTEDGEFTDTCEIRQFIPVDSVDLEFKGQFKGNLVIDEEKEDWCYLGFSPSNVTNKNVIWESTNKNVVTVDKNGKLTAVGEGVAYVTATSEDGNHKSNNMLITVTNVFTFEELDNDCYAVTGFSGTYTDYFVKIPSTYKGKPVTAIINDGDFSSQNYNVRGVQIPASITAIVGNLFYYNRYNTFVYYEGTLTQWCAIGGLGGLHSGRSKSSLWINYNDEENKINLMSEDWFNTTFVIPDEITRIEEKAFYHTNVRKISLPASISYIGANAFTRDDNRSVEIEFIGTIDEWVQIEGWNASIDRYYHYSEVTVGGVNLNDMTNVEINEATKIVAGAFYNGNMNRDVFVDPRAKNESLVTVILSDKVEEIEQDAFRNCVALTDIVIGTGMTKIEDTFEYTNLTRIFYKGDAAAWAAMEKPTSYYSPFNNGNATVYYFSADPPTEQGNFWHCDTDGVTPVIWD